MMTISVDELEIIGVLLSMIGQFYVTRRQTRGFWYWIFANAALIVFTASKGHWWMVGLYSYFEFSAIYAIWYWGRLESPSREPITSHA